MTDNRRIAVSLNKQQEEKLIELRKTDEFCQCSFSEIIRTMFLRGLEQENAKRQQPKA